MLCSAEVKKGEVRQQLKALEKLDPMLSNVPMSDKLATLASRRGAWKHQTDESVNRNC